MWSTNIFGRKMIANVLLTENVSVFEEELRLYPKLFPANTMMFSNEVG